LAFSACSQRETVMSRMAIGRHPQNSCSQGAPARVQLRPPIRSIAIAIRPPGAMSEPVGATMAGPTSRDAGAPPNSDIPVAASLAPARYAEPAVGHRRQERAELARSAESDFCQRTQGIVRSNVPVSVRIFLLGRKCSSPGLAY
jgi:hypothetical protein